MKKYFVLKTIAGKLFVSFGFILALIMILTSLVQFGAMKVAKEETYNRMSAQSDYYLDSLDKEISQIRGQQVNVMNDWDLIDITVNYHTMTGYERRSALLALKERLSALQGSFDIIDEVALYLRDSGYIVTATAVKRMSDADKDMFARLSNMKETDDGIEEQGIYLLEKGMDLSEDENVPRQLFSIHLSKKQIEHEMEKIVYGYGSSAFFIDKEDEITFSKTEEEAVFEGLTGVLRKNEDGYLQMQTVNLDGKKYLCFVSASKWLGTFVQYTEQGRVMREIVKYQYLLYIAWICIGLAAIFIVIYVKQQIHRPIRKLLQAFENVKAGNLEEHIHYDGEDEFQYLYNGFNDMEERINDLVEGLAEQKTLTQNAQMKQLQAQINPHFLYNSFFVLRRRIKRGDYENASRFSQLLGEYFKYITRNESDYTTLDNEIQHARCYAQIQAARFSNRIEVRFEELPEQYRSVAVPKLIVQPLLENVFGHGLENKMRNGILQVSFQEKDDIFLIIVEDNGEEADESTVIEMNRRLQEDLPGEVTGIVNIHRRLQICFKGNAGLKAELSSMGGVKICIYMTAEALKQAQGMYRRDYE